MLKPFLFGFSALLLSACSHTVFVSYPAQMRPVREDLAIEKYNRAEKHILAEENHQDKVLYQSELARVHQIAHQFEESLQAYAGVIDAVQRENLAAKVRLSKKLAAAGSMLTNDNDIGYIMVGYEQVMLYQYQALNYFALDNHQDALVSIRRADNAQRFVKQQHAEELIAAQKAAEKEKVKYDPSDYADYISETKQAAGKIKSSFENAFTYYLSSIAYESIGDYNNAFVSAKNALAVKPKSDMVRQQLLEVLQKRGDSESQIQAFKLRFRWLHTPKVPDDQAKVVVLYEQGLVPEKEPIEVPLPLPASGGEVQYQKVSLPVYHPNRHPIPHLHIFKSQRSVGKTEVLTNVQNLAAKALLENYPMIITREIIRLVTKSVMVAQAQQQSDAAALVAQIWSWVTANADLRSWLTLPRTLQVWQGYLPTGQQVLVLDAAGRSENIPVRLSADHMTVLWVVQVQDAMQVKVLTL